MIGFMLILVCQGLPESLLFQIRWQSLVANVLFVQDLEVLQAIVKQKTFLKLKNSQISNEWEKLEIKER